MAQTDREHTSCGDKIWQWYTFQMSPQEILNSLNLARLFVALPKLEWGQLVYPLTTNFPKSRSPRDCLYSSAHRVANERIGLDSQSHKPIRLPLTALRLTDFVAILPHVTMRFGTTLSSHSRNDCIDLRSNCYATETFSFNLGDHTRPAESKFPCALPQEQSTGTQKDFQDTSPCLSSLGLLGVLRGRNCPRPILLLPKTC